MVRSMRGLATMALLCPRFLLGARTDRYGLRRFVRVRTYRTVLSTVVCADKKQMPAVRCACWIKPGQQERPHAGPVPYPAPEGRGAQIGQIRRGPRRRAHRAFLAGPVLRVCCCPTSASLPRSLALCVSSSTFAWSAQSHPYPKADAFVRVLGALAHGRGSSGKGQLCASRESLLPAGCRVGRGATHVWTAITPGADDDSKLARSCPR